MRLRYYPYRSHEQGQRQQIYLPGAWLDRFSGNGPERAGGWTGKNDPTLRVIAHDKSSLAPEGASIAFRLDKENGFRWEGPCDITVDELLSGTSKGEKTKDAKSFLLEILADGQKSCNEIMDAAKERGIKKKTLWNAKKELNIDSVKVGSQWYWML